MPTEPLTDEQIAELRRLIEKAHRLPWSGSVATVLGSFESVEVAPPPPGTAVAYSFGVISETDPETLEEDVVLMIRASNALPALLDELEFLRRRDREQAAGEEVLRQQLRDAERRIEMLRVELGQRGR